MPRLFSLILFLVMSVAFAAGVIVAHKGITTVAVTCEEEKGKEGSQKKNTEEQFNDCTGIALSKPLVYVKSTTPRFIQEPLPEGFYHQPFNPPDAL